MPQQYGLSLERQTFGYTPSLWPGRRSVLLTPSRLPGMVVRFDVPRRFAIGCHGRLLGSYGARLGQYWNVSLDAAAGPPPIQNGILSRRYVKLSSFLSRACPLVSPFVLESVYSVLLVLLSRNFSLLPQMLTALARPLLRGQ